MEMKPPSPDEIAAAANRAESARFPRWMLPLAAGVSLAVGGLWWSITFRQMNAPRTTLLDGGREIVIASNGRAAALRGLPGPMQDALAETMRTGKIVIAPEATSARSQALAAGKAAELDEWMHSAGTSHLLRGLGNARAGLVEEAAREFRILVQDNPDSPLARQLLEQVETRGSEPPG